MSLTAEKSGHGHCYNFHSLGVFCNEFLFSQNSSLSPPPLSPPQSHLPAPTMLLSPGTPSLTEDAGYMVYWGTASGVYDQQSDAQDQTSQTILHLSVGARYYFAVTAYNQDGMESDFSEEISAICTAKANAHSNHANSYPDSHPKTNPNSDTYPDPHAKANPNANAYPDSHPRTNSHANANAEPDPHTNADADPNAFTDRLRRGPVPPPQYLLNISTRVRVRGGDNVMIGGFIIDGDSNKDIVFRALGPSLANLGVPRVLADPTLEVYDSAGTLISQNDNWTTLPSGTVPASLEPPNPAEAVVVASLAPGSYTAVLRSADGTEGNALCELYDLSPGNSTVRNISTRGEVGTGDDVMIGGFIIGGTTPAKIMVRAIGPSLAAFGVSGVLPDPVLELHDKDGSLIYQNDNWRAEQAQQIIDTTIPPSDESESAIIATLAPDAYTAIVHDAGTAQGVALVEVYMLDQ